MKKLLRFFVLTWCRLAQVFIDFLFSFQSGGGGGSGTVGGSGGGGNGRGDDDQNGKDGRKWLEIFDGARSGKEKKKLKRKCRLEHGVLTKEEISMLIGLVCLFRL